MGTAAEARSGEKTYEPVTPRQAAVNRAVLLSEVLAYEGDHWAAEDPWGPEVLARYGPDTQPPF